MIAVRPRTGAALALPPRASSSSHHRLRRGSTRHRLLSTEAGPLRVVIAGGGIAGLALATFLRRVGMEATVLERREKDEVRVRSQSILPVRGRADVDAYMDQSAIEHLPSWKPSSTNTPATTSYIKRQPDPAAAMGLGVWVNALRCLEVNQFSPRLPPRVKARHLLEHDDNSITHTPKQKTRRPGCPCL